MDTTSEIQALADKLVQIPNETGENLQVPDTKAEAEPVQAIDEIPQVEIEPVEQMEDVEAENESPSETIEFDGEDDDYDLTEVAETDTLIPVKINGKEERWTLDQLKQSAAGQGYINQQMQEVAQIKKQYTAYIQQATQQRERDLAFIQQAQQNGIKEPTLPSRETFDQDPIGYMEQKLEYDQAKAQYDAQVQQVRAMQEQQTQQREQNLQNYTMQQAQLLTDRLPEMADPKKSEAIKKGLVETGDYYGFTPDELGSVRDHRYIMAMYDAMRYRNLVNKRGMATSQQGESLPPVKSGARKRPNQGKAAARKKAEARLQKTGSVTDAIDLILNK